jgi:anti-anti-sigma factor
MAITTREQNSIVIFDLKGNWTVPLADEFTLRQRAKEQLAAGRRNFLLNFAELAFMDSFAVGELVASLISTQKLGGKLKLEKLPPKIRLIFQVTMLERVFEIYDDEEAAIRSFSDG